MRLERVVLHNIGPHAHFELDLSTLGDARLISVVGGNGSGKTVLLEAALPGAIYRETPTRGSLTSLATARDSYVEARIVNGKAWTIRHSLDCASGKSEALVLDEHGAPVMPDTKVRTFDAWAARTFPAPEVLFSSVFSAQAGAGFLGAKPGERKATLLRVLGVEKLERLAEAARERARDQKSAVATLAARVEDERRRGGSVEDAEIALADASGAAIAADATAADARQRLDAAKATAAAADAARTAYEAEERAYSARLRRRDELAARVRELDVRIGNNRAVLGERERIERAESAIPGLREEVARHQRDVAEMASAEQAAAREADAAERERQAAEAARDAASMRAAAALRALERAEEIEAAARCVPGLRSDVESAERAEAGVEAELEQLRGRRLAGAEERIGGLRGGLTRVTSALAAKPSWYIGIAEDALAADDAAVREAGELPSSVALATERLRAAQERLARARQALREVEALAALAGRLDEDRAALAAAEAEVAEQLEAAAQAAHRRDNAALRAAGAAGSREAHEEQVAIATVNLVFEEKVAAKAGPLAGATARLAELEPQVGQGRTELSGLDAELSAGPPAAPPLPVALDAVEHLARRTEAEARAAAQAVAVAEQRLEQARAGSGRAAELETELEAAERDLADWQRLAADLGRDGLQAAEIDAAGPELTELVNDLLHRCHGPRFTVSIETQRLSADGKRTLEGCEVRVLDVERGRDTTAETLSGGEAVLVGEAVSLALAMLACRRAGVERPTIVRDESGSALSPENARVYVSMLRRAAELVDADKVLLVSHTPEVWDLCDARVELGASP